MKFLFKFTILLACIWASSANAEPLTDPYKNLPVLQSMAAQGAKFSEPFQAPDGLTGFMTTFQGRDFPVYIFAGGKHVLYGDLLQADGKNLTETHLKLYPTSVGGEEIWEDLQKARWIAVGDKHPERVIYTFVDANCPYCHQQWKAAVPYLEKGLQVRYIMVAMISDTSTPKALEILSAADPAAMLKSYEESPSKQRAGKAATEDNRDLQREIVKNTMLLKDLDMKGTPASFYEDGKGSTYAVPGVMPDELFKRLLQKNN